jgi:hypothetical protein
MDKTFDRLFDRDSGATFAGMELTRCTFDNCCFSMTKQVDRRSTARAITLHECTVISSDLGPGILEDVVIDTLKTPELVIAWSPCLKHVVLRGAVGRIKINRAAHFMGCGVDLQRAFDAARTRFYAGVDWALDISEAEFLEFDVSGIPMHLIRRDNESQAILRRSKAENPAWRSRVAKWNTHWPSVIDVMLGEEDDEFLLVASKGAPKTRFRSLVDGLRNLRDVGVLEED